MPELTSATDRARAIKHELPIPADHCRGGKPGWARWAGGKYSTSRWGGHSARFGTQPPRTIELGASGWMVVA